MGKIGNFDTDADALVKRIAAHDKFGENDLNAWVFDSAGIESGMRVLDLGCGTGKQTLELLERGCAITAIDASKQALDILKKSANDRSVTILHSGLDDMASRVEGPFDRAISVYAIYYAKNPDALFRAIKSLLVDGGFFFFCGPAYDNNMEMKAFLTSIGQTFTPGAAPFMEETGPAIAQEVFGNVRLSKFENALSFGSAEALWTYWSSHNMFDANVEDRFRTKAEEHFKTNKTFRAVKRVRGVMAISKN